MCNVCVPLVYFFADRMRVIIFKPAPNLLLVMSGRDIKKFRDFVKFSDKKITTPQNNRHELLNLGQDQD